MTNTLSLLLLHSVLSFTLVAFVNFVQKMYVKTKDSCKYSYVCMCIYLAKHNSFKFHVPDLQLVVGSAWQSPNVVKKSFKKDASSA